MHPTCSGRAVNSPMSFATLANHDLLLSVKAVPGASRDAIAGELGGRLKIRVAAPPEGGKANEAICALVARDLGLKARQVTVEVGHGNPEKVLRVTGWSTTIEVAVDRLLARS